MDLFANEVGVVTFQINDVIQISTTVKWDSLNFERRAPLSPPSCKFHSVLQNLHIANVQETTF